MNNKEERQQKIVEIIQHQKISRQEELLEKLISLGYSFTQATLSRDLKKLRIGKVPDPQYGSIYFVSSSNSDQQELHGIQSIEWVRDSVLIKCLRGYANSVAASIDESNIPEIAGTIAGNDTILLVIYDRFSFDDFRKALVSHFNGIDYLF